MAGKSKDPTSKAKVNSRCRTLFQIGKPGSGLAYCFFICLLTGFFGTSWRKIRCEMVRLLFLIARAINKTNEWTGRLTAWCTGLLVAVVCFDVLARKLFNFSKIWIMDLEWHLFSLIFLMAAGYALKHDRHVRVDLFYDQYSAKDKALTNFWGSLLFLIPWCLIVIYYSTGYAVESFLLKEGSPEPGGLPARYVIKLCISIGIGLLLLQAIANLIESGLILLGKKPPEAKEAEPKELI